MEHTMLAFDVPPTFPVPDEAEDDGLSPARGCVLAFAIAAVMWVGIILWMRWIVGRILAVFGG